MTLLRERRRHIRETKDKNNGKRTPISVHNYLQVLKFFTGHSILIVQPETRLKQQVKFYLKSDTMEYKHYPKAILRHEDEEVVTNDEHR